MPPRSGTPRGSTRSGGRGWRGRPPAESPSGCCTRTFGVVTRTVPGRARRTRVRGQPAGAGRGARPPPSAPPRRSPRAAVAVGQRALEELRRARWRSLIRSSRSRRAATPARARTRRPPDLGESPVLEQRAAATGPAPQPRSRTRRAPAPVQRGEHRPLTQLDQGDRVSSVAASSSAASSASSTATSSDSASASPAPGLAGQRPMAQVAPGDQALLGVPGQPAARPEPACRPRRWPTQ